jgi:hypothetical protein
MSKRYDVLAPRKKRDGGTFWHRVGTAWEGDKGINVTFDSLPLPDAEGRVSVSLFEPRDRDQSSDRQSSKGQGSAPRQASRMSDMIDDEVPFLMEWR